MSNFSETTILPDLWENTSLLDAPAILSTSDLNGDGIVNFSDVFLVSNSAVLGKVLGRNDAIFDRNADGKVDFSDVQETIADLGEISSPLDQQFTELYQDTRKFFSRLGLVNAILEGYGAFTPEFEGHGEHWISPARIAEVLSKSKEDWTHMDYIGLNVEPYGEDSLLERNVLGVFYLAPPDNLEQLWANFIESAQDGDDEIHFGVPEYAVGLDLYADDPLLSPHQENWHRHDDVYIHYPNPLDPSSVTFEQNLTPQELHERYIAATQNDPNNELVVWGIETGNGFDYNDIPKANVMFLPSFQMMHTWINALNPGDGGIFGETNDLVSPNAPPLPGHHGHHGGTHNMPVV